MLKKLKKHKNNQGNTFIMVIVTLSFLAVLTSALLVAIALCYRLKALDINSRDNFYYLEQAMDEIYAGVGADSMQKLSEAYESTLEVVVYYDAATKSYVTMDNDTSNKMLKKTFIKLVKAAEQYESVPKAEAKLKSYMSYCYDDVGDDGVKLSIQKVENTNDDNLTLLNLTLSRTADYSTFKVGNTGGATKFTQSITTDLVIGEPQFNVSFQTIDASMNNLFSFSMIADKGIEITNSKVNITGDVYAASDFYNKDYNGSGTDVTNRDKDDTVKGAISANPALNSGGAGDKLADMYTVPVCSYGVSGNLNDSRFKLQDDGTRESSMYSGIYMSNSDVVITANKIVVPGTIASMNMSNLTVSAISGNTIGKADIWADSIVLGGYSMKKGGKSLKGSEVSLNANCYISDDLEVNATGARFALIGEYYGYNNSTTDNRSFSTKYLQKNGLFAHNWDESKNAEQTGQAHYNSSSVIINGENATLDLKDVSSMYIAGQSYIELSKKTKTETQEMSSYVNEDGEVVNEDVEVHTFSYANNDADGNYTSDEEYTAASNGKKRKAVQDYKTGEAVSIKSNQLAYIPPSSLLEDTDKNGNVTGYYVTLPEAVLSESPFKDVWPDPKEGMKKALSKIPVVVSIIDGKKYYYFDFTTAAKADDQDVNKFIAAYSKLFEDGSTSAAKAYLTDITDYEDFQVNMLKLPTANNSTQTDFERIYSNAALTIKVGNTFNIVADSKKSTAALVQAANRINQGEEAKGDSGDAILNASSASGDVLSLAVTNKLRNQYKEMKLLLTTEDTVATNVELAHTIGESAITPINHYFKFSTFSNNIIKDVANPSLDDSGYGMWLNEGDITIKADRSGTALKGIIICKGDVTFEDNVSSFEGLIVAGGKVIVSHNMDFIANQEVVKSVLRVCEDNAKDSNKLYRTALGLFRSYGGDESQTDITLGDDTENARTITTIQFGDILEFVNWKKNVTDVNN